MAAPRQIHKRKILWPAKCIKIHSNKRLVSIPRLCFSKNIRFGKKINRIEMSMICYTCSCVMASTTKGAIEPPIMPTKFIIAYSVPAKIKEWLHKSRNYQSNRIKKKSAPKFGAKSWQFAKFVSVAAPLNPNDNVIAPTILYPSPIYGTNASRNPGKTCAVN